MACIKGADSLRSLDNVLLVLVFTGEEVSMLFVGDVVDFRSHLGAEMLRRGAYRSRSVMDVRGLVVINPAVTVGADVVETFDSTDAKEDKEDPNAVDRVLQSLLVDQDGVPVCTALRSAKYDKAALTVG